jgi:hypothetical protein
MESLKNLKCVPCQGGEPTLPQKQTTCTPLDNDTLFPPAQEACLQIVSCPESQSHPGKINRWYHQ